MMTVHEVSKLTGVSVRTLHYYDEIGLLPPTELTAAGYRLYGEEDCSRLQQILLFRELEFPLKEIRSILASPTYDREQALRQQIELLELKKERIENLIAFAKEIRKKGGHNMDFKAFDNKKLEQYAEQAKKTWGETEAYKEYEAKSLDSDQQKVYGAEMMELFREFGEMKDKDPADGAVQAQVKKLQDYITAHYYTCHSYILAGLGQMYAAEGEFKDNIDAYGGAGTADFAAEAIRIYCEN